MAERWVRCTLTAELRSDAHFGSGLGGGGIDALLARDRNGRPVIWASHVEGVLRDAARRLHDDSAAEAFFGRAGGDHARGDRQRAVFTSLYANDTTPSHIWRSTAREAFDNRAPKNDTLRVVECVPRGTQFVGEVELPANELRVLRRLVQEVDAFGGSRSTGRGRVKLSLAELSPASRHITGAPREHLRLLLKNRDPICITATATPDNLIPSLAFVPGRALLGAIAAWLIDEGDRDTASLLTSGRISVSDALPLPDAPQNLIPVEVLPAPLSLQIEKPRGSAGEIPWWAQPHAIPRRLDAWSVPKELGGTLKRSEDDLFVYRAAPSDSWLAFRPSRRVRLRNGRPDPNQVNASLFALEQIVEDTPFVADLQGSVDDLKQLVDKLAPVLEGARWLRVGRAGAPVEVVGLAWSGASSVAFTANEALLTLTSDLLVRDDFLRWRTALDEAALRALLGTDVRIERSLQDSVMVHGFNGTSRLWRMPAAAVRRGSVFKISGPGVGTLAERAARGQWLGERTHEGFGRFRIDTELPGLTGARGETPRTIGHAPVTDAAEEEIAERTRRWFERHKALASTSGERKPSLSQWLDLAGELELGETNAIESRLHPTTAGAKSWKHRDANAILQELSAVQRNERARYARFFVSWLRAELRANQKKGAA